MVLDFKFDDTINLHHPRYHSLAPMYYRGAQAAIVVYDITNAGENLLDLGKIFAFKGKYILNFLC